MKVNVLYRSDPERPLTDPVIEPGGPLFVFRLYRGTFCHPVDGTWFDPQNIPTKVIIEERRWMPFIMWQWSGVGAVGLLMCLTLAALLVGLHFADVPGLLFRIALHGAQALLAVSGVLSIAGAVFHGRVGYAGYKLYGVDSKHYKTFLPPEEVYVGSQACHFSIRPFATSA